jgi:hypothetical protein
MNATLPCPCWQAQGSREDNAYGAAVQMMMAKQPRPRQQEQYEGRNEIRASWTTADDR